MDFYPKLLTGLFCCSSPDSFIYGLQFLIASRTYSYLRTLAGLTVAALYVR